MRLLLVSVLMACGRYRFDPVPTGGEGDGAATADTDAISTPGVRIMVSATGNCPSVAWSGDRLGIVWREGSSQGAATVQFAAYDLAGTLVQGPLEVGSGLQNVDCPTIAWTDAQFLVGYAQGQLNRRDLFVATVTTSVSPSTQIVNDSGDSTQPRLASLGSNAWIAWLDNTGTNFNTMAMALSATGTPKQTAQQLSTIATTNDAPVPFATTNGFAATWAATGGARARAVDQNGVPTGAETVIGGNASTPVAGAWTGSDVIAAWCPSGVNNLVTTARFDLAGTITMGPFSISSLAPRDPSLVWTGSGASVIYYGGMVVQYWIAQLAPTGEYISQMPIANWTPGNPPLLFLAATHLVAAYEDSVGATILVLP